jgi:hypothetical protein
MKNQNAADMQKLVLDDVGAVGKFKKNTALNSDFTGSGRSFLRPDF